MPISSGNAEKEGLYRITIEPEDSAIQVNGQMEPLQPGMQVEADILLENRYLYEWILGPVVSLRDRIAGRTEIQHSSAPDNPEI